MVEGATCCFYSVMVQNCYIFDMNDMFGQHDASGLSVGLETHRRNAFILKLNANLTMRGLIEFLKLTATPFR